MSATTVHGRKSDTASRIAAPWILNSVWDSIISNSQRISIQSRSFCCISTQPWRSWLRATTTLSVNNNITSRICETRSCYVNDMRLVNIETYYKSKSLLKELKSRHLTFFFVLIGQVWKTDYKNKKSVTFEVLSLQLYRGELPPNNPSQVPHLARVTSNKISHIHLRSSYSPRYDLLFCTPTKRPRRLFGVILLSRTLIRPEIVGSLIRVGVTSGPYSILINGKNPDVQWNLWRVLRHLAWNTELESCGLTPSAWFRAMRRSANT